MDRQAEDGLRSLHPAGQDDLPVVPPPSPLRETNKGSRRIKGREALLPRGGGLPRSAAKAECRLQAQFLRRSLLPGRLAKGCAADHRTPQLPTQLPSAGVAHAVANVAATAVFGCSECSGSTLEEARRNAGASRTLVRLFARTTHEGVRGERFGLCQAWGPRTDDLAQGVGSGWVYAGPV